MYSVDLEIVDWKFDGLVRFIEIENLIIWDFPPESLGI